MTFMGSDHLIVGLDQLLDEIQGVGGGEHLTSRNNAFQTPQDSWEVI